MYAIRSYYDKQQGAGTDEADAVIGIQGESEPTVMDTSLEIRNNFV